MLLEMNVALQRGQFKVNIHRVFVDKRSFIGFHILCLKAKNLSNHLILNNIFKKPNRL